MMQINLSELISKEGKILEIEAVYEPEVFRTKLGDYPIVKKDPIQLRFTNLGEKRILLEAVISISLLFPCDRCLEEVQKDFHIEVEREFDMKLSDTERIEALDETNFISGNNLDVDAFVYGEILLNLPMKVLCRKDCKGICNRCGTNLNNGTCNCDRGPLDPRMAKILDVFQNSGK